MLERPCRRPARALSQARDALKEPGGGGNHRNARDERRRRSRAGRRKASTTKTKRAAQKIGQWRACAMT
jgi:hypothetical protein